MIDFIVCDDELYYRDLVNQVINKVMMGREEVFRTYSYNEYDEQFLSQLNDKCDIRFYILDIETKKSNGISIAKKIRKNDLKSHIIFLTSHEDESLRIFQEDLNIRALISKNSSSSGRLTRVIIETLACLDVVRNVTFKQKGQTIIIPIDEIHYIYKDNLVRKTIINTEYKEYHINKSLSEVASMINSPFIIQSHRSCYVNVTKIRRINYKESIIIFHNGTKLHLLSDLFRRELEKNV